jgi:hypothetical protein
LGEQRPLAVDFGSGDPKARGREFSGEEAIEDGFFEDDRPLGLAERGTKVVPIDTFSTSNRDGTGSGVGGRLERRGLTLGLLKPFGIGGGNGAGRRAGA